MNSCCNAAQPFEQPTFARIFRLQLCFGFVNVGDKLIFVFEIKPRRATNCISQLLERFTKSFWIALHHVLGKLPEPELTHSFY